MRRRFESSRGHGALLGSGRLRAILLLGNAALSQTIALAVTFFVAIGVIVNLLVVYIVGGVLAERRENQERRERGV